MARSPAGVPRKPDPIEEFYVYDSTVENLGGQVPVDRDGDRIVRLTQAQAQYLLDQGVLGTKPLEKKSAKGMAATQQLIGEGKATLDKGTKMADAPGQAKK